MRGDRRLLAVIRPSDREAALPALVVDRYTTHTTPLLSLWPEPATALRCPLLDVVDAAGLPVMSRRSPGEGRLEGEDFRRMATLDTHAIARTLTDAGADSKLADAITAAVREAADHGDHVTPDQFKAGLAELEARLTWRFAGAMLAQTGVILAAVIGAAVAILRMLGT